MWWWSNLWLNFILQIDHKEGLNKKEKADKEFLERLEQVQLAEDLAAQREQFMRERYGEREKYKDALATQVSITLILGFQLRYSLYLSLD